jgi:hypothetical protein
MIYDKDDQKETTMRLLGRPSAAVVRIVGPMYHTTTERNLKDRHAKNSIKHVLEYVGRYMKQNTRDTAS